MKNIEYINKLTSKNLEQPIEIVAKINNYYWNAVKVAMRNLDDEDIFIKEIGTFQTSYFKINKQIVRIRDYIRNLRGSHKYTPERKEKIIHDYKLRYKKSIDMRARLEETMKFQKTYRKLLDEQD